MSAFKASLVWNWYTNKNSCFFYGITAICILASTWAYIIRLSSCFSRWLEPLIAIDLCTVHGGRFLVSEVLNKIDFQRHINGKHVPNQTMTEVNELLFVIRKKSSSLLSFLHNPYPSSTGEDIVELRITPSQRSTPCQGTLPLTTTCSFLWASVLVELLHRVPLTSTPT